MRWRRPIGALAMASAGLILVGATSATVAQQPPRTAGSGPRGVVALGHSGVLAWNADAARPQVDAPEYSWATGTAPEVRSIYQRLIERIPETEGNVANLGTGGAPASLLAGQAEQALAVVPEPALVLIKTIDGDIRCDGTDEAHVPGFGADLAAALDVITSSSPASRILVQGQLGRPDGYLALIEDVPEVVASLTGTGPCTFFEPSGEVATERIAELTAIIEAYEAEQARICARYPQCRDDGGLTATWVDTADKSSSDWNHLSVAGHAAKAELIWPLVADLLELHE